MISYRLLNVTTISFHITNVFPVTPALTTCTRYVGRSQTFRSVQCIDVSRWFV